MLFILRDMCAICIIVFQADPFIAVSLIHILRTYIRCLFGSDILLCKMHSGKLLEHGFDAPIRYAYLQSIQQIAQSFYTQHLWGSSGAPKAPRHPPGPGN